MYNDFRYINHKNEAITFGSGNILINQNDIRDYEWSYERRLNNVTSFQRSKKEKKIPCIVYGPDRYNVSNKMFETFEKDVMANQPGTLFYGDYYIRGYIYASKKSDYANNGSIKLELSFVANSEGWIKETKYIYRENDSSDDRGLGYNYGYPYDFLSTLNTQNLFNGSFAKQNINIVVYGPATNPKVQIGENDYQIYGEVYRHEYLTIDTKNKTVIKTTSSGEKVNMFAQRNLDSYIFEKIDVGQLPVRANPTSLQFDVTVLEERSEPKWM